MSASTEGRSRDAAPRPDARGGFTLVELLVAALIGVLILTAAYSAIMSQSALFRTQSEVTEARTTLRSATALLSSALMEVAANDGDVTAVSDSSFVIRQYIVTGTVCSHVTSGLETRFGLQELRGQLGALTASDSVLVYDVLLDDWNLAGLGAMWTGASAWAAAPGGGGTPVCFWGDSTTAAPRPQATARLDAVSSILTSVRVGAALRVFRSTEYGVFQRDGAWWLGRRVSGATTWELLTGPLVPPTLGGVEFTYFKSDGTATTTASEVTAAELFLWSRGGPRELDLTQQDRPAQDSVRVRVHVRNNTGV